MQDFVGNDEQDEPAEEVPQNFSHQTAEDNMPDVAEEFRAGRMYEIEFVEQNEQDEQDKQDEECRLHQAVTRVKPACPLLSPG